MRNHVLKISLLAFLAACAAGNKVPVRASAPPDFAPPAEPTSVPDDEDGPIVYAPETLEGEMAAEPEEAPPPPAPRPDSAPVAAAGAQTGCYKIGSPYIIDGIPYYPHEDPSYSEIGVASHYGACDRRTAADYADCMERAAAGKVVTSNGEVFDENKLTAAHRTLPMPSFVRVTNLENSRALNLKVNDRGPFARDRIIDVSNAAADFLGMKRSGSARVKVELLAAESARLKELAIRCENTDDQFDVNAVPPPGEAAAAPAPEPAKPAPAPDVQPMEMEPVFPADAAPAKPAPAASTDGYFVQVAAYGSYEKAEAMKNRLVKHGDVKIFKAVQGGQTLFKVRLGEFADRSAALEAQKALEGAGIAGSRIILKEGDTLRWQ